MPDFRKILILLSCTLLITGCASSRPVLYPNTHLSTVGMEVADRDIASCMEMARSAGADNELVSETARETAEGAVAGGATGAAVGAVLGSAGRGAATGAAGGATGRLTSSILNSDRSDPIFEKFVNRCLYDKGYDVVGWR